MRSRMLCRCKNYQPWFSFVVFSLQALFLAVLTALAYGEGFRLSTDESSNLRTFVIPKRLPSSWQPFRSKRESVEMDHKDLHPQFVFNAFGKRFHLALESDAGFVSPDLMVQYVGANLTTWEPVHIGPGSPSSCFYSGHLVGEEYSALAVSLCHGMMGHIWTSTGRFFIEPVRGGGNLSDVHVVYRYTEDNAFNLTKDDGLLHHRRRRRHHGRARHPRRHEGNHPRRRKRSMSYDLHVEVMIVADSQMQRYHGESLQHYILTLMSMVSLIYKDASIGNSINIAVVKLSITDESVDRDMVHTSASKTLKNFCKWQALQNDPDERSPLHHDTAILLTREDICRSPTKCDTLGLAELGTMCDPYNSCSIVEDNGLSAAFTIAHELGHVLSMPHDDDILKCHRINNGKQYHVMARMLDYNTFPWAWSSCSSHFLTEFLDAGLAHCLRDEPAKNKLRGWWGEQRQPGEMFTDNKQCELVYGVGARICPYMPVCKLLWCMTNEQRGCRTHHMPWADGTKCGDHKWCQKGECRRKDPYRLLPVDGGWGKWNKYGSCSRSCGGGIQKALRYCNKPKPDNGGRYCVGRRIRYRSCNTKSCGVDAKDFREEQCAAFNGKHFNIHGLPANVTWVTAYAGINPKDRCKLFCRVSTGSAYYVLKEKVVDGTPCGPDSFDVCVNGICLPGGCDNRLGSTKKLDHCGVCGGNNSTCKTISGHLNKRLNYGYTDIVRIPSGSNNIDVRQHGYNNSEKDDNYIALKTPEDDYILNGNFSVILFKKIIQYGGSVMEYTGAGSVVERINSSKPLQKDLIIQVLSVKDLLPPDIHYQYTISTTDEYRWTHEDHWRECNASCQGVRVKEPYCIRSIDMVKVDDDYCWKLIAKPEHFKEPCNMHCKLSWRITHKSECSAQCGHGNKTLTVQCVQVLGKDSRILNDWYCLQTSKKPETVEPCEVPCSVARWEYGDWSKCSKSCGGGVRYRSTKCVLNGDTVVDGQCPKDRLSSTMKCGQSQCPSWKTGEWLYCSASCGTGERQRAYWCEVNGKEVHGSLCDPHNIPEHKQSCILANCPEWTTEQWGQCSSSCGRGISRRAVICTSDGQTKVDDSQCNPRHRPDHVIECELPPCASARRNRINESPILPSPVSVNRMWKSGSWGECSTTCGVGFRKREVICYNPDVQMTVDDENECNHLPRPLGLEFCNEKACGKWATAEWSECTVTCGAGVQKRNVTCVRNEGFFDGGGGGGDVNCDPQHRPISERLCGSTPCVSLVPRVVLVDIEDDDEDDYNDKMMSWHAGQWGLCSRKCGSGFQRRQVVCQDESGNYADGCDPKRKPIETAPCNEHDCPVWIFGRWGACTRTCGSGLQRRRVFCRDHQGLEVTDNECEALKPVDEQSCNTHDCGGIYSGHGHRWQTGPWTSCSTSCGPGIQERHVVCIESDGRIAPPSNCESIAIATQQNCTISQCPIWNLQQDWSPCSVTCGGGLQTRIPLCYYENHTVDDGLCVGVPPPGESRTCNTKPCPMQWFTNSWSPCSKSCNKGKQMRSIYCVDGRGIKVDDRLCNPRERPRLRRACNKHPCPYTWKTGYWSECSTTCGPGVQTRTAFCHEVNPYGWMNPDPVLAGCNETERPAIIQACNYGHCNDPYQWKTSSWTQCSVSCGRGYQRRRVYCQHYSGRVGTRQNCRRVARPQRKRKCSMPPCEGSSCWDVQRLYGAHEDGEQEILIRGKMVRIFCANMNTSYPHEYVTLVSGESENYSEMYDKRLIRPETCPYNGERVEQCECVDDGLSRAGFTAFSKIRLNITNLRIIAHDFTFARAIHGHLIPYAEAADCYSSADCPQGRFSVNLASTGFIVSEFTEWMGHGNKPSIKILQHQDGVRVQGRCGGYCGKCTVDPLVGLLLEVAPP